MMESKFIWRAGCGCLCLQPLRHRSDIAAWISCVQPSKLLKLRWQGNTSERASSLLLELSKRLQEIAELCKIGGSHSEASVGETPEESVALLKCEFCLKRCLRASACRHGSHRQSRSDASRVGVQGWTLGRFGTPLEPEGLQRVVPEYVPT